MYFHKNMDKFGIDISSLRLFYLFLCILNSPILSARVPISSKYYELLSGKKRNIWDKTFDRPDYIFGKMPVNFLRENIDFIPPFSRILDMGMAEGRNSVFLAEKGHIVTGVDISAIAINKSEKLAKEKNVKISTILGSLKDQKFSDGQFDVIVAFYYMDREVLKKAVNWLRPGGLFIIESYTNNQKKEGNQKYINNSYFLKQSELLTLFPNLKILKYEEPQHKKVFRASIILQRPKI